MLGYVLTLGTQDAWCGLVPVLMARLTVEERANLATMALKALDRDDAMKATEAALSAGAGQPQAPLFSFMDQAAFWADLAEREELEAYCLASFNGMSRERQAAFLDHVRGGQAA